VRARWLRALIPGAAESGTPPLGGRAVCRAAACLREKRRRGRRWAGPARRRAELRLHRCRPCPYRHSG